MAVDELNKIHRIEYAKHGDEVYIVVTDHLEWGTEQKDIDSHIEILNAKLETYVWFVEQGEFARLQPELAKRNVLFKIYFKYDLHSQAQQFLLLVKERLQVRNIGLEMEIFPIELAFVRC